MARRKRSPEDLRESADNHYSIALGSAQNGSFDDAKKQIELALGSVPDHANAHYLLGLIQLHEGRTIIEFIEAEMCLTDEAADAQRLRADDLHRAAHASFGKAAEAYQDNDPGLGRAYNSMAVVSLYFHDHERAENELEHALAAQFYTEKYSALANLGWAFYERGDLVSAMTELRQSVLMNPDYCVGPLPTGAGISGLRHDGAGPRGGRARDHGRALPDQDAYRVAGIARMRLGQQQSANDAFNSCSELAPRSCLANACRQFVSSRDPRAADRVPNRPRRPRARRRVIRLLARRIRPIRRSDGIVASLGPAGCLRNGALSPPGCLPRARECRHTLARWDSTPVAFGSSPARLLPMTPERVGPRAGVVRSHNGPLSQRLPARSSQPSIRQRQLGLGLPARTPKGSPPPGPYLKAQRKRRGMSLDQLAAATKIPRPQLELLEADRYDELPGMVFTKGFLRCCARALELDPDTVLGLLYERERTQLRKRRREALPDGKPLSSARSPTRPGPAGAIQARLAEWVSQLPSARILLWVVVALLVALVVFIAFTLAAGRRRA